VNRKRREPWHWGHRAQRTEAFRQVHEKLKSRSQVCPWHAPPARARNLVQGTPVRKGSPNCSTAEVKREGGQRTEVRRIPPGTESRYARNEGPSAVASTAVAGCILESGTPFLAASMPPSVFLDRLRFGLSAAKLAAAGNTELEPVRSPPLRRLATASMQCVSSALASAEARRREAPPEASRIRSTKDEQGGARDDSPREGEEDEVGGLVSSFIWATREWSTMRPKGLGERTPPLRCAHTRGWRGEVRARAQ
jgi:hypothetical protein